MNVISISKFGFASSTYKTSDLYILFITLSVCVCVCVLGLDGLNGVDDVFYNVLFKQILEKLSSQ